MSFRSAHVRLTVTVLCGCLAFLTGSTAAETDGFEKDIVKTSEGDLAITFIGHASYMFAYGGMVIHVDPWSRVADYSDLPNADLVLITHGHIDHLDPPALALVCTDSTMIVYPPSCAEKYPGGVVMRPGDKNTFAGIGIEAVHAYNLTNLSNPGGRLVHPKGMGVGYILTFGGVRVYCMGETENVPEMRDIKDIDIAFMAMDSVYNLTPVMAAGLAKLINPAILYPIHFADEDPSKLTGLLEGTGIEVRIRNMK